MWELIKSEISTHHPSCFLKFGIKTWFRFYQFHSIKERLTKKEIRFLDKSLNLPIVDNPTIYEKVQYNSFYIGILKRNFELLSIRSFFHQSNE